MTTYVLSPDADGDLSEIADYIAADSPAAAERMLDSFHVHFRFLGTHRFIGRPRERLAPALRSFPVGSYVIFYRPAPEGVEIVRVLHGARKIGGIFPGDLLPRHPRLSRTRVGLIRSGRSVCEMRHGP